MKKMRVEEHRLYSTWRSMHNRCKNPNNSSYDYYGGRGISVCRRWENFWLFVEDMWPTYEEGLTLDRRDNLGNYCPSNCRWASRKVQANNQRREYTKIFYNGDYHTESSLSELLGVSRTTLQQRRVQGWSDHEIVHGKPLPYLIEGIPMTQKDVAEYIGISPQLLNVRLRKGFTVEEVIDEFKPVQKTQP